MSLYVVRHAPVTVTGLCYGQHDVPTTLSGEEACALVLPQLEGLAIDQVWASPWARAREPATHIAGALALPFACDARLSELCFGAWEGRTYASLEEEEPLPFAAWMESWESSAPPQGERVEDLLTRVAAWRREYASCANVLVVAHAGTVRALRALAKGVSFTEAMRTPVPHLTVERVGVECVDG